MGEIDTEQFYKMMGTRVRELRGSKLTQESLAKATGLSRVSIVNLEAGRQKFLLHHVFAIAKALGITPSALIAPLEQSNSIEIDLTSAGDAADFVQTALQNLAQQKSTK